MDTSTQQKLLSLEHTINDVISSERSDYYKNLYSEISGDHIDIRSVADIERVPKTNWESIATCPLNERLYIDKKLFVKTVYKDEMPVLFARTTDDIAAEDFGASGERPLVALDSSHESIEKSLWFYENNILPLIRSADLTITAMIAAKYEIDAIVADTKTLAELLPTLKQNYDVSHVHSIVVIDTAFDLLFLKKQFPLATIRLVMALPETGSLATQCPESMDKPLFHPNKTTFIEKNADLTVSRLIALPTPIIRYETGIAINIVDHACACQSELTFH